MPQASPQANITLARSTKTAPYPAGATTTGDSKETDRAETMPDLRCLCRLQTSQMPQPSPQANIILARSTKTAQFHVGAATIGDS